MGQSIYFDYDFNKMIEDIRGKYSIPKYIKDNKIISIKELDKPLAFFKEYIPNVSEQLKDIFSNITIKKSLVSQGVVDCDGNKRTITLKGYRHRKEDIRQVAYFIGEVFSEYVPSQVTANFILSNEGDTKDVFFLLDSEEVDYKIFFGYFFEYLYLIKQGQDDERDVVGLLGENPNDEKYAFDIFIKKYLNIFLSLSNEYNERCTKKAIRLAESNKESNVVDSQDGSSELTDLNVTPSDLELKARLIAFDKVLELIYLGLSNRGKIYKTFLDQCLNGKNVEKSETPPISYKYIKQAYAPYKKEEEF